MNHEEDTSYSSAAQYLETFISSASSMIEVSAVRKRKPKEANISCTIEEITGTDSRNTSYKLLIRHSRCTKWFSSL